MPYTHKVKFKRSVDGKVPKGYELQVLSESSSKPTEKEVKRALAKAGLIDENTAVSYSSTYDVLK